MFQIIWEQSVEIRTFIAFLGYNFAKFFLKSNIFLNEFWFSLNFTKFFMFQKFSVPSAPKIGLFGRFLPKILVFLDLKVPPFKPWYVYMYVWRN